MSDKLDLFEATIKRSLEHFEAPVPSNAWSELEQKMAEQSRPVGVSGAGAGANVELASAGSGFLQKFMVAGAFLLGSILLINQSVVESNPHPSDNGDNTIAVVSDADEAANTDEPIASILDEEAEQSSEREAPTPADGELDVVNDMSEDEDMAIEPSTDVIEDKVEVDESEANRMVRINERLQQAAEKANEENNEERYTTRYVGKDFNLGAPKEFSPNHDGVRDSFIPTNLKSGDEFIMTVSSLKGEKIFSSQSIEQPWMGVDSAGKPVDEGKYRWEVVLQKDRKKEIFKGVVLLER